MDHMETAESGWVATVPHVDADRRLRRFSNATSLFGIHPATVRLGGRRAFAVPMFFSRFQTSRAMIPQYADAALIATGSFDFMNFGV